MQIIESPVSPTVVAPEGVEAIRDSTPDQLIWSEVNLDGWVEPNWAELCPASGLRWLDYVPLFWMSHLTIDFPNSPPHHTRLSAKEPKVVQPASG